MAFHHIVNILRVRKAEVLIIDTDFTEVTIYLRFSARSTKLEFLSLRGSILIRSDSFIRGDKAHFHNRAQEVRIFFH